MDALFKLAQIKQMNWFIGQTSRNSINIFIRIPIRLISRTPVIVYAHPPNGNFGLAKPRNVSSKMLRNYYATVRLINQAHNVGVLVDRLELIIDRLINRIGQIHHECIAAEFIDLRTELLKQLGSTRRSNYRTQNINFH